jgi:structure-specific recognition protein 1
MEKPKANVVVPLSRESFDNIYLDLSKESGKCRFAETGFGWKPSGGGDTFTLDATNIGGAQWSRASKGFEVKILLRSSGVLQLDGFQQEVSFIHSHGETD